MDFYDDLGVCEGSGFWWLYGSGIYGLLLMWRWTARSFLTTLYRDIPIVGSSYSWRVMDDYYVVKGGLKVVEEIYTVRVWVMTYSINCTIKSSWPCCSCSLFYWCSGWVDVVKVCSGLCWRCREKTIDRVDNSKQDPRSNMVAVRCENEVGSFANYQLVECFVARRICQYSCTRGAPTRT